MVGVLGEFWHFRGYNDEGKDWLMRALTQTGGVASSARGKALREAGRIVLTQGNYAQATALLEDSLNLAHQLGDKGEIAVLLNFRGLVALYQLDLVNASIF